MHLPGGQGSLERFTIEHAAFGHVMRDVCDVDAEEVVGLVQLDLDRPDEGPAVLLGRLADHLGQLGAQRLVVLAQPVGVGRAELDHEGVEHEVRQLVRGNEPAEDLIALVASGSSIPALPYDLTFAEVFFPLGTLRLRLEQ